MDNKIIVNGQVVAHSSNSYNNLDEVTLPMINSAKLIGNLTSSELNMYTKAEVEKLVASARSVKLVENYPSSPSAGILYYVGTEAPYQVCTYSTDTLARIDLGSTETDLSEYVKLIPSHKDETGKVIYEVGHNEGIDDGRELVAHSVTGIINEIDTALQDRVNVLENDLTTENKKVVEAINELKDAVDKRVTEKIGAYKNKSPQDIFNEVYEESAGVKVYNYVTWGANYVPQGVSSYTSGGCVVHVNGDKDTAESSRYGAMYWQDQGNGDIYVCYLKQNVAQPWKKLEIDNGIVDMGIGRHNDLDNAVSYEDFDLLPIPAGVQSVECYQWKKVTRGAQVAINGTTMYGVVTNDYVINRNGGYSYIEQVFTQYQLGNALNIVKYRRKAYLEMQYSGKFNTNFAKIQFTAWTAC